MNWKSSPDTPTTAQKTAIDAAGLIGLPTGRKPTEAEDKSMYFCVTNYETWLEGADKDNMITDKSTGIKYEA